MHREEAHHVSAATLDGEGFGRCLEETLRKRYDDLLFGRRRTQLEHRRLGGPPNEISRTRDRKAASFRLLKSRAKIHLHKHI